MRIGLIDADGRKFPNLALMRISSYHKNRGDTVEWWWSDFVHYDIVYISKVFSSSYAKPPEDPINADLVIKGGTGFAIRTECGKEFFDGRRHGLLPDEIERCFPDYSIYPEFKFAVSMTSRGCPRGCAFCHVAAKEGRRSVKVANVSDFWAGQSEIKVLDANITACEEKLNLLNQYLKTGALIDFTQGLDIRLIVEKDIEILNEMRLKNIHFAWDNPREDLKQSFEWYARKTTHKPKGSFGTVYVLTNFNSTLEQDLMRIYLLKEMGYDPYVMIYDKPSAAKEKRMLQRWCNNRVIFKSCPKFEDYRP